MDPGALFSYRTRMQAVGDGEGAPTVSETFAVKTNRFNSPYVRDLLAGRARRHRMGLWIEVATSSWLCRELRITVHGAPDGISQTREAVGFAAKAPDPGPDTSPARERRGRGRSR